MQFNSGNDFFGSLNTIAEYIKLALTSPVGGRSLYELEEATVQFGTHTVRYIAYHSIHVT